MNQNYWLIILFVATMVCNCNCRPRESELKDIRPAYRSDKQLDTTHNSFDGSLRDGTINQAVNIESIATVARASNDGPSAPSSAVIGHFVDAVHQMVDSDIRTPPKLKEILKEKNTERKDTLGEEYKPMPVTFIYDDDDRRFHRPGGMIVADASERKAPPTVTNANVVINDGSKGIAIPVVIDDSEEPTEAPKKLQKIAETVKPVKDERRKIAVTKIHPTTTPSSGLSTWILLSDNREATTTSPKKNNKKEVTSNNNNNGTLQANNDDKKKISVTISATTKKPAKVQPTTLRASVALKKITTKVTSTRKPDTETTSALEAMVKNQKKGSTPGTAPLETTQKPKKQQTDPKKKFSEKIDAGDTEIVTLPPKLVLTTEDPTNEAEQQVTETSVEVTTKKKKTSSKKKKKNKKKTKKPETGVEPKIPGPAVGSQIYNFLSREIVPTVGLGLIGVALTAGLASFLGYNPFVSPTVPLRRTYETNHGYSPSSYYSYNTDYSDGGQSEEVLLREVLSGMPEESRYGLTHGDTSYSEIYNRKDQSYSGSNNPVYSSSQTGSAYGKENESSSNYDSSYSQEYSSYSPTYDAGDKNYPSDYNEKYPVYTRETGTSFVYPETTGMTSAEKVTGVSTTDGSSQLRKNEKFTKASSETIERQPEALYRVAGETDMQYRPAGSGNVQGVNSQNNWHRMGTPVESSKTYARLEPGPRSLKIENEGEKKKRTKRGTSSNIQRIARKIIKKETDAENEVDFEDPQDEIVGLTKNEKSPEVVTTTTTTTTTTTAKVFTTKKAETITNEVVDENMSETTPEDEKKDEEDTTEGYQAIEDDGAGPISSTASVLDILKKLAQFKLRLGLNFLRSTTDMFSRYLDVIQRKVDESFTNTTTVLYNRQKNPWSRIFYGGREDNHLRKRRSALQENPFLASLLTEEAKHSTGYSKSTKKELKSSDKVLYSKKTVPKKFRSKGNL